MPRKFFGRDLASLSPEEKKAISAEIRSKRKGNGRLGYRSADAQLFETNNFELPESQSKKKSSFAAENNEHIKCVFVCARDLYPSERAYGSTPIYLVSFLSDSNRFSFEEFRDSPSKIVKERKRDDISGYRVSKFFRLFSNKNMDGDTDFYVCMDEISQYGYFFQQIKTMCCFLRMHLRTTDKIKVLKKILSEYEVFKTNRTMKNCENYPAVRLNATMLNVYRFLAENRLCPWISEEEYAKIFKLSKFKKYSIILSRFGLLYVLILRYAKMLSKKNSPKT